MSIIGSNFPRVDAPDKARGRAKYTANLQNNIIPSIKNDQPVLASEMIRYFGEPFAVVAAGTREEAEAFSFRKSL